jgi:hypothetical protein
MEENRTSDSKSTSPVAKEPGNAKRIDLAAPWAELSRFAHLEAFNSACAVDSEVFSDFVSQRSRVHEVFIREQAKSKRMGLLLSAVLIALAALIVMFAPDGRRTLSYWIGAALLIFSAGASGFGRVWGKAKNISFGADQDLPP